MHIKSILKVKKTGITIEEKDIDFSFYDTYTIKHLKLCSNGAP